MPMIISINTYTLALFEVACEQEKAKSFYEELKAFEDILSQEEELLQSLNLSVGDYRIYEGLWESLEAFLSKEVINFLKILQEASLLDELERVVDDYRDLMQKHGLIHKVDIRSAQALNQDEKNEILKQIKRRYEQELDVRYEVDEKLISGIQVIVDSDVYDLSIQHKLDQILSQGGHGR